MAATENQPLSLGRIDMYQMIMSPESGLEIKSFEKGLSLAKPYILFKCILNLI